MAALRLLEGRGLPVPRLLGHGVLPSGVPWTLETRVAAEHVRPTRAQLATPDGWEQHRALGRWLPALHAVGGFACYGTWSADGPARLSAYVLARARAAHAKAAALDMVSPALLRRGGLPSTSSSTAWAHSAGRGRPTGHGLRRRSGSSSRSWTASACVCPAEHRPS